MNIIYLIHFSEKLSNRAQHYIGFTTDIAKRLGQYKNKNGNGETKILEACRYNNISFEVVRVWYNERPKERELKKLKNAKLLCPVCNPDNFDKRKKENSIAIYQ